MTSLRRHVAARDSLWNNLFQRRSIALTNPSTGRTGTFKDDSISRSSKPTARVAEPKQQAPGREIGRDRDHFMVEAGRDSRPHLVQRVCVAGFTDNSST